ncbi:MAG: MazG-like family protein [Clostridia bacterium]|nr:MazG-like family protein [Clostridia bacterium]
MVRDKISTDSNTTIDELKARVHELCLFKGWGADGVQNAQHVAMAMSVEMSELLEHFLWLDENRVEDLMNGLDMDRVAQIAEEFADVMMYGLQLARTLGIDITSEILRKIEIVKLRPNSRTQLAEKGGLVR